MPARATRSRGNEVRGIAGQGEVVNGNIGEERHFGLSRPFAYPDG
jgi:hypothetical protein